MRCAPRVLETVSKNGSATMNSSLPRIHCTAPAHTHTELCNVLTRTNPDAPSNCLAKRAENAERNREGHWLLVSLRSFACSARGFWKKSHSMAAPQSWPACGVRARTTYAALLPERF